MQEIFGFADEMVRQTAEKNISSLAASLKRELAINEAQRNPDRRVRTSILVTADDGGFIALDGSAHRLEGCFRELFRRRPELRFTVQSVLDGMYHMADIM